MKYLKLTLLVISLLACPGITLAQNLKNASDKVNGESFSYTYLEPVQEVKGILILLPGWGESTQSIFGKTKLPSLLSDQGFVTVVPQLHQTMFADDYTIAELDTLVKTLCGQYHSDQLHLIIGGLSAGGAIAIDYAEYLLSGGTQQHLKGVFAIDPPLDLNRMYRSQENKINYTCKNKLIAKEGEMIKKYLLKALNGSPSEKPEIYLKCSAFSAEAPDGGNAKYLKNIPVRLYSEPDLDYVRRTFCEQLQPDDINAFDLEKLNKFLESIGNTRARYITTTGKGFHSWNILEPVDCAAWIAEICSGNLMR